jgi:hypothetical protein
MPHFRRRGRRSGGSDSSRGPNARRLLARCGAHALAISAVIACAGATPALAKAPNAKTLAAYLKEDTSLADEYAAIEGSKLKVPAPNLQIAQSSEYTLDGKVLGRHVEAGALTGCTFKPEGGVDHCTITVSVASHRLGLMRLTMAHEVFHAFQAAMSLNEANWNQVHSWLTEGSAEWVARDVLGAKDPKALEERAYYLNTPSHPLFSRDYDAIGFFDHMQSVGIDPWKRFTAMFADTSDTAAYQAAVGGDAQFFETEASVFFHEGGWPWAERPAAQPPAGSVHFKPGRLAAEPKEKVRVSVAPYADGAYHLTLSAMSTKLPVLEVLVKKGYARIRSKPGSSFGSEVDQNISGDIKLCSDPKGCSCPAEGNKYPKFKEGDLAVTGTSTGALVELVPAKRCETLLSPHSCEGVLPGFTPEPAETLDSVADGVGAGKPFEKHEESGPDGFYSSSCLLLMKGSFVEYTGPPTTSAEGVELPGQTQTLLNGVIASVNVTRYGTEEQATTAFQTGAVGIEGITTVHALGGIEDEAAAGTREILSEEGGDFGDAGPPVVNDLGQHEYLSVGYVRVRNVTATIQLGGNEEADGEGIYKLLQTVSGEL